MQKAKTKTKVKTKRAQDKAKSVAEAQKEENTTKGAEEKKGAEKPQEAPKRELDGTVDEYGNRYLNEADLYKWLHSGLRINNLRHQASETRTRLENLRLDYEMKKQQHLVQADAFERAAKERENNDHVNLVRDMGARYGVDFEDPNVLINDETGKITVIDPEK